MTTDHDLLAKIDALTPEQRLKALRAVVELHTEVDKSCGNSECCYPEDRCNACDMCYPCPTIQAIEKELGND